MDAKAVIFETPGALTVDRVGLADPKVGDVVVKSLYSGISTGTERLLWEGKMPEFPGLGYPLVPGYETVGEVVETVGPNGLSKGDLVFVPGTSSYKDVRGLFGGAASQILVDGNRVSAIKGCEPKDATLLALAATAHHALCLSGSRLPDLIIGYGVLGRLAARMVVALGGEPPRIWETDSQRRS
ncbi:MAG: alcohol dehydrogenase catalytic domain-containing protein, partial [Pseudomonadota bacterium]